MLAEGMCVGRQHRKAAEPRHFSAKSPSCSGCSPFLLALAPPWTDLSRKIAEGLRKIKMVDKDDYVIENPRCAATCCTCGMQWSELLLPPANQPP